MNRTNPVNSRPASNLAKNLAALRGEKGLSLEKVAEAIGVTRQAVAKWESGETAPDILNCNALADLYNVSLDALVQFDQGLSGGPVPAKGKHLFGTVQLGERGQIVIPKKARDTLGLQPGDTLLVLGDTNPGTAGLALVRADETFLQLASEGLEKYNKRSREDGT